MPQKKTPAKNSRSRTVKKSDDRASSKKARSSKRPSGTSSKTASAASIAQTGDEISPENNLSLQRELYIEEYLRSGNATQAAIAAGYSEATARQQGSRLLTIVDIRKRIQERIAEAQIETDEVLGTIASFMRGSLEDFLEYQEWGPPKINLELAQQRGVLHLLKELSTAPDGSIKIRLHDSLAAAVQLSRIMNLDKSQQRTGTLTISQIRAALAKENKR